jgi:hypothetical protein
MGYVHDTHMSLYIPPTAFHCVTGTWTQTAGTDAGTISKHKASADDTCVVNIPLFVPSNSVALKGAKISKVEVDYEITGANCTDILATCNKITRAADGTALSATDVPVTQDLAHATDAGDVDDHKLTVTITTPAWIDNDEYYLLVLTIDTNSAVVEMLGAVVYYTLRA